LTSKVDIWSAGIIFYELLNGKRPTKADDIKSCGNKENKLKK
jgi:serine/threonine protein kinase